MNRPTLKQLDKLWMDVIKARASQKSEWSGKDHSDGSKLAGHHITGKPNYTLRYDLKNGVCVTCGEHKFIAHHTGRAKKFRDWALKLRGIDEDYITMKSRTTRADLWIVMAYLKQELKKYDVKG